MGKKKETGICRLCKTEDDLTFEHVPPQSAFNNQRVKKVNVVKDVLGSEREQPPWDLEGLPYQSQQRGSGGYWLCSECNNNTGTWYGSHYAKFVTGLNYALKANPRVASSGFSICGYLKGINGLAVIKQILVMFITNGSIPFPDERLQSFLLSKESRCDDLSKRYKVCLYLNDSTLRRQTGYTMNLSLSASKSSKPFKEIAEIVSYPVGLILYINPTPEQDKGIYSDITDFATYEFGDLDLFMKIPKLEINSPIPLDFRSKEEIKKVINYEKITTRAEVVSNEN